MKLLISVILFLSVYVSMAQNLTIKSDDVKIEFLADMQKTDGTIGGFEASINFDTDDLSNSSIKGAVDTQTLNTGNKKRDKHLKSDDFFDAEKYPKITFESESINKTEQGFEMQGTLSLAGETHTETINFTFSDGTFKAHLELSAAKYKLGMFGKKKPEKTMVHITMTIPVE